MRKDTGSATVVIWVPFSLFYFRLFGIQPSARGVFRVASLPLLLVAKPSPLWGAAPGRLNPEKPKLGRGFEALTGARLIF